MATPVTIVPETGTGFSAGSFPYPGTLVNANSGNAANTVTCPALGAGNTNNVVNAFGFVV